LSNGVIHIISTVYLEFYSVRRLPS